MGSKAYYRKQIVDLRASISREREAKKRDNQRYARLIKGASSTSTKANYRKSKISASASHDRRIDYLKGQVKSAQEHMKRAS